MTNIENIESIFFKVLADLKEYLDDLTLVGGWTPYVYSRFLWNNLRVKTDYHHCFEMKEAYERSRPITIEMIAQAKENIILRRETHIDQLADKLQETRVCQVIGPRPSHQSPAFYSSSEEEALHGTFGRYVSKTLPNNDNDSQRINHF